MQLRTRTWFAISLLCFLVAAVFWQLAERKAARDKVERDNAVATNSPAPAVPGAQPANVPGATAAATNASSGAATQPANEFPNRLSNTTKSLDELSRSEQSILLRNALLDSAQPVNLTIPPHLKSEGDPGSYVAQSRGPMTDNYRALLRQAGAEIVSYVPNNAYLIRATEGMANQLRASPLTQLVLPWEPYFKLEPGLLETAIKQTTLPPAARLNVLLFLGERERVMQALAGMDADVLEEDRSPFGPQLVVRPSENDLVKIARLPGVQVIEMNHRRKLANDLSRQRVRLTTNALATTPNYLNLDGSNITVNVNDTGVWAGHPDLTPARVFGDSAFTLEDFDGHGTHVAGTIASSGLNSPNPTNRIPGSVTNSSFRGMAPAANIFALPLDRTFGPNVPDSYLQETPAQTNALISNNSWAYIGAASYNLSAASWDAAVRDALPGAPGSQPLLAVFAAGNSGSAGIDAPGTAKNVITVGAIESGRRITNEAVRGSPPNLITNQPWIEGTDSTNSIASFSSVGNIGRNLEGPGGRFKPDLVAPGTFTISTRSTHWSQPTNSIGVIADQYTFERIRAGRTNFYQTFVPANGQSLTIECVPNAESRTIPLPPLHIHVRASAPPTTADFVGLNQATVSTLTSVPDAWHFSIANTNQEDVYLHVRYSIAVKNDVGNELIVLAGLQNLLAPYYRFETGTSMAAPVVSGLLALMQQYLSRDHNITNPSPALLKALLINGARTLGSPYSYSVTNTLNEQGWGLPNITNTLPESGMVAGNPVAGTVTFFEQSPERALVTGQSLTWDVDATALAQNGALRFTLVWTDPPGNPAVSLKLVNDLDLVVSNKTTQQIYYGNAFGRGSEFITPSAPTVEVPSDIVNNVENVFIDRRQGGQFAVTVRARRVNVDAVHTNTTAQDFALVVSCDNRRAGSTITVTPRPSVLQSEPLVHVLTNGVPVLNQRVGANSPFLTTTNGVTNQWHFYVATNTLPPSDAEFGNDAAATNIAFFTFQPPNLSLSRSNLADIDLFVSTNPAITNLDETVIASSLRGVGRGGTEAVIIENATPGAPYYIGVKSEDQQAANYGIAVISSSSPFSQTDSNGVIVARGYTLPAEIPDGEPTEPKAALVFALVSQDVPIKNVVVTNALTHEHVSDLIGVLQHDGVFSVLNNHTPPDYAGFIEWVFDDSDSGSIAVSEPTHSPGTLRNFAGNNSVGLWQMSMVDDSAFFSGQVDNFVLRIEPRRDEELLDGTGVAFTILPGRWDYTPIDIPADATNLLVCVSMDEAPLEVYIARSFFPTRTDYDIFGVIAPPGDCLSLGRRDAPPLSQGRYFIGLYNPNSIPVNGRLRIFIQRDLNARTTVGFRSDSSKTLFDDATTNSVIRVNRPGVIADVSVGVRIEHPRASDLVMHLVSPQGTRVLLTENRGGLNGANYGFGTLQELTAPLSTAGGALGTTNVIGPVATEGVIQVDYEFFGVPDRMTIYYDNVLIFDSGLVSGAGTFSIDYGSGFSTNIVVVMNEGNNPNQGTAWQYTAKIVSGYVFTTFTDNTNFTSLPIKFAIPPFTNFNYFATNYITNGVVMEEGFDTAIPRPCNAPFGVGSVVSGWTVVNGDVDVIYDGCGFTGQAAHSLPYALDIDGQVPGTIETNLPTTSGKLYNLSFAYTQVPGFGEKSASISISGSPGLLVRSDQPNSVTNLMWRTTNLLFTATGPITTLTIQSLSSCCSSGMFFDSFKVEQLDQTIEQGIYFKPEEPLTEKPFGRLIGENAFGNWVLEVWDNRIGAGATNSLLAWKLNITYVNTNPPAVTLTNGMAYCATLASNETAYFIINVPISAGAATNTVNGSENLSLIYNSTGLPRGQEPPDTFFLANVPEGVAVLDGGGWNSYDVNNNLIGGSVVPQIRPGRRYYLGVQNRFPGTNAFCVKVEFDSVDPTLVPITPIYATNNPPCEQGTVSVDGIVYYSFDVSSNAIGAEFSISNIGGDVNLYVKRGLPLPRTDRFYAKSENPGVADEFIQVADFTGTLLPGRWYLAVVGTPGSGFEICAREIPGPVTPIAVNTSYPLRTVGVGGVQYYRVTISSNAIEADFETRLATGDVDLYVSKTTMMPLLTAPTNALFSATTASGNELIPVTVFLPATNRLTPGEWYLAVVNNSAAPVDYSVYVKEITTNIDYITLISGVPYTNSVGLTTNAISYYRFDVATNALQVVFDTSGSSGDVDMFVRYGFPLPPPGTNQFDFASTNTFPAEEWIALHQDNTNALPLAGSYWIAVVPRNPLVRVDYKVRATQILDREVPRLFNGIEACVPIQPVDTNALHSGVHFYRIDIGSNAVQALFEVYNADGNVDLYLQHGLPITNYSLLMPPAIGDFMASEAPGLAPESICLLNTTIPTPLQTGTWYLAVVNRETNDVNYCIRATVAEMVELTNGVAQCRLIGQAGTPGLGGIDLYWFNVATNAVQAVFETFGSSGNVDLYVTPGFQPVDCTSLTNVANYIYSSRNGGSLSESICVRTNSAPSPLNSGGWFVAVVNREANRPSTYCIRATQLRTTDFVRVAPGTEDCSRTVGVGNGAVNAGVNYYLVSVTNGPALMTFETYDATGNVDLFVGRADANECVPNFGAFNFVRGVYPYGSANFGIAPECVMVDTNTGPVPLSNGDWYVAVVNRSQFPVDYCLLASEFATNPSVRLTSGVPACPQTVLPTNSTGGIGVNYYVINVSTNALRATFETYGANGNVDIYLQYGFCFPHRNDFGLDTVNGVYSSTNGGVADEFICLDGNSFPAPLRPGDWYVAVVNRDPGNVDFCIRVRELLDTQIPPLTNTVPFTNNLATGGFDFYRYRVSTNAVQVNFEILQTTANVDLYLEYGFCSSNAFSFSYASTNGGATNELIVVATNSAPVPLAPGEWFIAVANNDILPADYVIRVTEVYASEIIRLTNAIPYTNTVAGTGSITNFPVNYYVFNVSTSSVRAQFEILAPNGNVNLVARKGLPLPGLANTTLASTNASTGAELIVLSTNSTPVALTPGDWFLTVLNPTTNAVTYSIVATEYGTAGTNIAIPPGGITLVSNLFCLTWVNTLPGVNYYVQGKPDLNATAWIPVSPTIRATTNSVTWCVQLPSVYRYFRLIEGLSPLSAGNPITFTGMSSGTNGISLTWTAPPNQRYVAEWTPTLFPPSWRPYPDYITSTNTTYTFIDDGSKTGGLGTNRYYRFFLVP